MKGLHVILNREQPCSMGTRQVTALALRHVSRTVRRERRNPERIVECIVPDHLQVIPDHDDIVRTTGTEDR